MNIGSCKLVDIQKPKCNINPTTNNWKQTVVNERILLQDSYPDIKSIQSVTANLKIISTNAIVTPDSSDIGNIEGTFLTGLKLIVNGIIEETITYSSGEACKLYSINHTEPFTTFIVLDRGFNIEKEICIKSCIEGIMVNRINCREIQKNVAVFVAVN